jgi:hypothetical protein
MEAVSITLDAQCKLPPSSAETTNSHVYTN